MPGGGPGRTAWKSVPRLCCQGSRGEALMARARGVRAEMIRRVEFCDGLSACPLGTFDSQEKDIRERDKGRNNGKIFTLKPWTRTAAGAGRVQDRSESWLWTS